MLLFDVIKVFRGKKIFELGKSYLVKGRVRKRWGSSFMVGIVRFLFRFEFRENVYFGLE